MSTGAVVLVIVLVIVVSAAAWFVGQLSRRRRLRERFGPEYDRSVKEADNRRMAERVLTERRKRHASFDLKPLSDSSRERYAQQWTTVQEKFVDQPGEAVVDAEALLHAVLRERGYPTDGFEQQAADLSVQHAPAVDYYRSGHEIRTRHARTGVSTEELRMAMMHYRKIFVSVAGLDSRNRRAEVTEAHQADEVPEARDGHTADQARHSNTNR